MRPLLDALVGSGASASAAVALVGTAEEVLWEGAAGEARPDQPGRPVTPATRFDLASLTKPFTATLALALDAAGALPLATRLGEVWPEAHPRLARARLADLLRHRAGFQAWAPLYHLCRTRGEVEALLTGGDLLLPAGRPVYSDLDVLLYGLTVERATGEPLAGLLRSRVLDPLGLAPVEPAPGDRPDVAAHRMDTGKEVELAARLGLSVPLQGAPPPGLPQDGNARFLAGLERPLAAHAGLFGRARDLWRLGVEWLAPRRLLHQDTVSEALRGRPFLLGWWRRTLRGSAGRALSPGSFGHTGFAGGSLWIDPEARRIFVLLAHRTEPAGDMNRWRRRFHALAARHAWNSLTEAS